MENIFCKGALGAYVKNTKTVHIENIDTIKLHCLIGLQSSSMLRITNSPYFLI